MLDFFLSDPNRDVSQSNKVFKGKEILIIESITMGVCNSYFWFTSFIRRYINRRSNVDFRKKMGMFLSSVIILGTVLTLMLIIIFSIRKELKKIDRYIEQME